MRISDWSSDVCSSDLTDIVTDTIAADVPPRTREILTALVRHLHAFAREVDLTHAEWLDGCRFLYEAGRHSDERRNEFILLSDILAIGRAACWERVVQYV